ncbi:MAG: hypothetical protein QM803_02685 [Rhodocyclaceae bacterium]
MLYLLAASSFIEIASDTYAANLAEYFEGDPEVVAWLSDHWEREEVQHGRALRSYVNRVWPDFDWQTAYDSFFDEYSKLCTVRRIRAQSWAGDGRALRGRDWYVDVLPRDLRSDGRAVSAATGHAHP